MKANELMIGDWVKPSCWNERVILVGEGRVTVKSDSYTENEIKPIPLTAEILDSNGFESKRKNHFYLDGLFTKIDIHNLTDSVWIVKCEYLENSMPSQQMIVCNVHELQHALRFCEIDKEIEL